MRAKTEARLILETEEARFRSRKKFERGLKKRKRNGIMQEGSVVVVVVVCRRWYKNGCERSYYERNRGGREKELTGECRGGKRRNQRDGSLVVEKRKRRPDYGRS